ncbi:hypothetical protein CUMW_270470, partial [Citrus unshiu]
ACYDTDSVYNTANGTLPRVAGERKSNPNSADARPMWTQLQIDEGEQKKRKNQIESARGKMEKYKMAASAILTPKVGYGFADELKTAWFWVRKRFINGEVIRKEVASVVMEGLGCFEEIGVDL